MEYPTLIMSQIRQAYIHQINEERALYIIIWSYLSNPFQYTSGKISAFNTYIEYLSCMVNMNW